MGVAREVAEFLAERLRPLRARIDSMIRATTISSAGGTVALRANAAPSGLEDHEDVEVLEPHGFASVPPDGSTGVLLCSGGDVAHPILVGVGDRSVRIQGLATGEVAIYVGNAAGDGARVVCRVGGGIEVQPGPGAVVRMGAPAPAPAPAVARSGDPTLLKTTDIASLNALITAWNLTQPGGGPVVALPALTLVVATGTGTITAGGTGSVST